MVALDFTGFNLSNNLGNPQWVTYTSENIPEKGKMKSLESPPREKLEWEEMEGTVQKDKGCYLQRALIPPTTTPSSCRNDLSRMRVCCVDTPTSFIILSLLPTAFEGPSKADKPFLF